MSHEINTTGNTATRDNVLLRKKAAWHGLGTVIEDDLTAVEAGERAGLFWGVQGHPLLATTPGAVAAYDALQDAIELGDLDAIRVLFNRYHDGIDPVPTHKANVRVEPDSRSVLGVVGADYAICQNQELAEFADALSQTGKVTVETCGSIKGGKRIWFLCKGEAFDIGSTGDTVYPYLCVSNGHDGSSSIRVTPTTVRVVCSNTLHMVIPRAENDVRQFDRAAISIRHSGKISDKLEAAKEALKYYGQTLSRNIELFEEMRDREFSRDDALKLFAGQYSKNWRIATNDELGHKDTARVAELRNKRMDEAAAQFLRRYDEERAKFGGENLWLAVNAWTGYTQHDRRTRGKTAQEKVEARIEQNLFGVNAERAHDVLEAAFDLVA